MKSNDIRTKFLHFFESKKHQIVPSAPMVLKNDPTLMFVNSGMAPFKEYFLGNAVPKNSRIADSQKCLRVSGKHNDLEEVGKDTYHHTMFEMLGNWSFGDYFKKEAISWAWELLTEVYKVNKDDLYVTVFEGDKDDNLGVDQEALELWKAIVPEEKILYGNKKDNFWEMGDQGPCGSCSEIHVDIRSDEEKKKISGRDLVNQDHPQVVEIWNLVFMQYNRLANGKLEELPNKHIDTGMGFERLCMVLQDKQSNYDTDVFTPLIREIETITKTDYDKDEKTAIAIRVVADHVRAVTFAIADGQLPSNNGAGYVIRRILRRAIRYGYTFLGTRKPFIYKLVSTLVEQMGEQFPELQKQKNICENVIKEEENSFLRTLEQGLVLLESMTANTKEKTLSGKKAFELYDTYGFPIDLTSLILSEKNMQLDYEGFEKELQKQKERSRDASKTTTEDWQILIDDEVEEFVGYDRTEVNVRITKYRKITTKKQGNLYQLVFNLTPFYPEGGGQVGDKGFIEAANGNMTYIIDTKKENNLILHFAKNLPKDLNGTFKAVVDENSRKLTASNHSATHLLHQALRTVLGKHVEQKGSMVNSDYLRFDFSHFAKVSDEELQEVERFVNARIREQLPLEEKRNIPYEEAIENGAIALFGEKYGDAVRTIGFGDSVELCGGTHVKNTNDIWHFIITNETAVASGIRRIEAITGETAKEFLTQQSKSFDALKSLLKSKEPIKSVAQLQDENNQLKKEIEKLLSEKAQGLKVNLKNNIQEKNGVNYLVQQVDVDANAMKDICFQLGGEVDNLFVFLSADVDGKALLTCYISKDLAEQKSLNAGTIVREMGKHIQGGGGGQAFFATAGGKNPAGIAKANEDVLKYLD
ncbi:alanine--tRNA ligase [Mesonia sp. K7]|uniref:alanine--tRNA ligase n=1 Tax=Mesonia sp. K7 TaxID=2218606 RepID=UPI000DA7F4DA|nr:alanine--tRNA ligase [Mesonia sp. K7]PZD78694.1 alanine--tRNA ligase [Mesonia sp. K7]